MKVIALLSFYDETPEMLTGMIDSIADYVDMLVAVDGAYGAYIYDPHEEGLTGGTTGTEQAEAITDACYGHGVHCVVYTPPRAWEGHEIQKRTFLFDLGHHFATPGEDWFWVMDADQTAKDAQNVRPFLEGTECDAALSMFHEAPNGQFWPLRVFFRAQATGIRVKHFHAYYETGDGRVVFAAGRPHLEEPAERVPDLVILNEPHRRSLERDHYRREFYNSAVLLGLDDYVG